MTWKRITQEVDEGGDHRQTHWDELQRQELETFRHGPDEKLSAADRLRHVKVDHPDLFEDFMASKGDEPITSLEDATIEDLHAEAHRLNSGSTYNVFSDHDHSSQSMVEAAQQAMQKIRDHLRALQHS